MTTYRIGSRVYLLGIVEVSICRTHTHACEHPTAPFARPGVGASASYRGGDRIRGAGRSERGGIEVGGGNGDGNGDVDGHEDGDGAGTGTGVEVNEGAQDGNGDGSGGGDGDGDGGGDP